MNKASAILFSIVFGTIGFWQAMKGNPMGWVFVLFAAWSIIATLLRQGDAKDGKDGGNGWFDIGGCGGCGGCGD